MGFSWTSGVVLGLALSVASTVVLIRVLSDSGQMQSPTGRIAVGWLVMEDIFTVFILVLLPVDRQGDLGPPQLERLQLGQQALLPLGLAGEIGAHASFSGCWPSKSRSFFRLRKSKPTTAGRDRCIWSATTATGSPWR